MRLGFPTDGATLFLRTAFAQAAQSRSGIAATDYALRHGWGQDVVAALTTKASVQGGEVGAGWGSPLAIGRAEFVRLIDSTSLLGKIPFAHRVPPLTPFVYQSGAVAAQFVGQSQSIPVATVGLGSGGLPALKAGTIVVVSGELIESADPRAIELLKAAIATAIAGAVDYAFIAGGSGTANLEPAAVNYNVGGETSSGTTAVTLAHDLGLTLEAFHGDLATAFWVTSPSIAANLFLRTGGLGIGAGISPGGNGTLLGLPLFTSTAAESTSSGGTLTLIDGARLVIVDAGFELTKSPDATLEMSDSGTGRTDSPSAITQSIVSVFQENAVAFRGVRYCNWYAPSGAVVTLSGLAF